MTIKEIILLNKEKGVDINMQQIKIRRNKRKKI